MNLDQIYIQSENVQFSRHYPAGSPRHTPECFVGNGSVVLHDLHVWTLVMWT